MVQMRNRRIKNAACNVMLGRCVIFDKINLVEWRVNFDWAAKAAGNVFCSWGR